MDDPSHTLNGETGAEDVSALGAWAAEFAFPRDLAALFTDGMSETDKVIAVRRALYRSVPVSVGAHVKDFHHKSEFAAIADALAAGDKGLWCAGVAFVFHRALESLGFKVWTIHFGFADDLTHTANVVDVGGVLEFHDAYLNEMGGVPFPKMLALLDAGVQPSMHRETRDKKIHIVPADYADSSEVEWYVANSPLELPGAGNFRRFALFPNLHRDRVTYSWTGQGAERLRKLGLPEDLIFLALNPVGVFDGRSFQADPARMPLYREWLEAGGRTLAQRLAEKDLDAAAANAEAAAVGAQISALEAILREDNAALRQAQETFQGEWADAQSKLNEKVRTLEAALADTLGRLHDFATREAASRREAEAQTIAARDEALAREEEDLSRLVVQIADELRALAREGDATTSRSAFVAAVEALRDSRKIAAELLALRTREQFLLNAKQKAEEEHASMLKEVNQLSLVVNRSRYLRWRRRIKKLLTGRE